jgi:hypothetical protein
VAYLQNGQVIGIKQKVRPTKERTEKVSPLLVATQSHPALGMSKKRTHLLPRYFPQSNKTYSIA